MSRPNYVRRPWVNYWEAIRYDKKELDQQCKLIRNQVCSMDLGLPGFNLYDSAFEKTDRWRKPRDPVPTGRERYLEWVTDWKKTYAELSSCIRDLKAQRKPANFAKIRDKIKSMEGDNRPLLEQTMSNRNNRVEPTLDALRISAQIMLNARHIGKLASSALRQRAKA